MSKQIYRWKGRIVKKRVYDELIRSQQLGKSNRKESVSSANATIREQQEFQGQQDRSDGQRDRCEGQPGKSTPEEEFDDLDGRRIIELKTLSSQLWCVSCKEALSLEYIENEVRRGFGSIWIVRCHKCLLLNEVTTGKQHLLSGDRRSARFDINAKAVMGALHSGMGWTHLNKLCACMNIPCPDFKTFKKYEVEVGTTAEEVAKESCRDAAALEKKLTMENIEVIEKSLPENYQSNFINPQGADLTNSSGAPIIFDTSANPNSPMSSISSTTFNDVLIRVVASYDMGWSKRGTGRNYDSLNGYGAAIGAMSGLVMDYSTCNRKCKKCDNNVNAPDHDCRKNFYGSAKAMEPHVAKKLIVQSSILKEQNIEVGVLVGDDDSSTIAACRAASNHDIVKQSDINHATGGVKRCLYNQQKSHAELTKDTITYLHRCFTYALAQNKGNSKKMAAAIRSIPHHAFNDHSQCGEWCGYNQDKENYDHTIIPGGFDDPTLFEDLKQIFYKLADNAQKFSSGASSNRNESLNSSMASKAPKSRCYSLTASADYRFACVVAQKNLGAVYTQKIAKNLTLSPGKHHTRHVSRVQKIITRNRISYQNPACKKRRNQLKKLRTALRHRKENTEGVTYRSNCGLFTEPAIPITLLEPDEDDLEGTRIVFLDLETTGLERNCDILQIAAKCGSKSYSKYVTSVKAISESATAVHGLTNSYGELYLDGLAVDSVPLRAALSDLHEWLSSFDNKCCIAVHNLKFDGPRLMKAINSYSLIDQFAEVIEGFADTLLIIRQTTGRTKCSISDLAKDLNISLTGAHNAVHDCEILSTICRKLNITKPITLKHMVLFAPQIEHWMQIEKYNDIVKSLSPMKKYVGASIRMKLAKAGQTMEKLYNTYVAHGEAGLIELISSTEKKKSFQRKSIVNICSYFKENVNNKNT